MNNLYNQMFQLFSLQLQEKQLLQFKEFQDLLLDWNSRVNLTALTDPHDVEIKHFVDSASCSLAFNEFGIPQKVIDVGTGAGFPGIVLAILFPQIDITLVDSVGKKINFCNTVISYMKLKNIVAIHNHSDELKKLPDYLRSFDCVVTRAVAPLKTLIPFMLPFVHSSGMMLALKGKKASEEVLAAEKVINSNNIRIKQVFSYTLPFETTPRSLIALKVLP